MGVMHNADRDVDKSQVAGNLPGCESTIIWQKKSSPLWGSQILSASYPPVIYDYPADIIFTTSLMQMTFLIPEHLIAFLTGPISHTSK